MNRIKTYVDVTALFTADGRLVPTALRWEDGRVYQIVKITDVRRACSLRAGGTGIRYTCIVEGKETHLFYEGERKWFVERKEA